MLGVCVDFCRVWGGWGWGQSDLSLDKYCGVTRWTVVACSSGSRESSALNSVSDLSFPPPAALTFDLISMWYCVDLWSARWVQSDSNFQVNIVCFAWLLLISLITSERALLLFSRVRSESTSLSFCCCAVAREAHVAGNLQGFHAEFNRDILVGQSCFGNWLLNWERWFVSDFLFFRFIAPNGNTLYCPEREYTLLPQWDYTLLPQRGIFPWVMWVFHQEAARKTRQSNSLRWTLAKALQKKIQEHYFLSAVGS